MSSNKYVGYFPHDSNAKDDPKIMIMMAQLGLEAYGIYWLLIEFLRDQEAYQAPLILLDPLARRFGSSKEKFEAVVMKFNLFAYDDINFYSPSLNKRMHPLDEKRVKMSENASKRWIDNAKNEQHNAIALPMHSNCNTEKSRVEKSKEEKSRIKKSQILDPFSFCSESFIPVWEKWLNYRKEVRKPYRTETGMITKYNELVSLSGNDASKALAIVDQSIGNEWTGFFPLKTNGKAVKGIIPGEDPVDKMIRECMELDKKQKSTSNGI
jgi:uncharacterized protein YdaU (DUF1376 family)